MKCDTCGMVYTKCQEEDEEQHAKYHQRIVRKLRFNVRQIFVVVLGIDSRNHYVTKKTFH